MLQTISHDRSRSGVFTALCPAFFLAAEQKPPASAPIPTALVAPATRGNLASTLTVAGQFQPYQEVELHAKVSGYIRRINVDIGDHVHNGEVIATLEVPN